MRVTVDEKFCESSGECAGLVPEVFTVPPDGRAKALDGDVPVQLEDDVYLAVDSCPRLAITVLP